MHSSRREPRDSHDHALVNPNSPPMMHRNYSENDMRKLEAVELEEIKGTSEATSVIVPTYHYVPTHMEAVTEQKVLNHHADLIERGQAPLLTLPPEDPLPQEPNCSQQFQRIGLTIGFNLFLLYLITPNAMNAFEEPSGVRPENIDGAWFNGLSSDIKFRSILNAILSYGINRYVLQECFPQAAAEMLNGYRNASDFKSQAKYAGGLLVALVAAFAFAAMAFDAFQWIGGAGPALIFAFASLIQSFVTRAPNVFKAARKIVYHYDPDMRLQRLWAQRLRQLKPEYAAEFNLLVIEKGTRLDKPKSVSMALYIFAKRHQDQSLEDLLRAPAAQATVLQYLRYLANRYGRATFAGVLTFTALQTFTQKGFDGLNVVATLTGHSWKDAPRPAKFFAGLTAGVVSSGLYYLSTNLFPNKIAHALKHLGVDFKEAGLAVYANPRDTCYQIPHQKERILFDLKIMLVLYANWAAKDAMVTVGNGIVRNSNGIFQTTTLAVPFYAALFPLLAGWGAFAFNCTSSLNQVFKAENAQKVKEPKTQDVADNLEVAKLPSTTKVRSHKTGKRNAYSSHMLLDKFSLLKPPPAQSSNILDHCPGVVKHWFERR